MRPVPVSACCLIWEWVKFESEKIKVCGDSLDFGDDDWQQQRPVPD